MTGPSISMLLGVARYHSLVLGQNGSCSRPTCAHLGPLAPSHTHPLAADASARDPRDIRRRQVSPCVSFPWRQFVGARHCCRGHTLPREIHENRSCFSHLPAFARGAKQGNARPRLPARFFSTPRPRGGQLKRPEMRRGAPRTTSRAAYARPFHMRITRVSRSNPRIETVPVSR